MPQEKPSEIRSVEKGNLPDGMESLFDGSAGLRFSRDKRMLEVFPLDGFISAADSYWRLPDRPLERLYKRSQCWHSVCTVSANCCSGVWPGAPKQERTG